MNEKHYPVVIAGGGPCGLMTSLLLARFGVENLVLERHPDISIHPKAMAVTRRTGEIYRQLGIYDRMRAADVTDSDYSLSVWAKGLAGDVLGKTPIVEDAGAVTPCVRFHCPQPHTEAVLAREIRQYPHGEIKHYCQVDEVAAADDGVRVLYTDRASSEQHVLTADYLIAADGAKSPIREQLGIPADGPGDLGHFINVYFRANYGPRLADRRSLLYNVLGADFFEFFVTVNGFDLWLMHHFLEPGESIADYPESRVIQMIKQASGMAEVPVEIISELPWVMSPKIARSWREGRVFFVGDSAARLSPAGGLGMNTGLHGAHNLAWKLAATVHGIAGDSLLDSYEAERLPVARFSTENSNANFFEIDAIVRSAMEGRWDDAREKIAHSRRAGSILGQDLGMTYESECVTPDGSAPLAAEDPVNDYTPSGRPGGRAPHLWLEKDGSRSSTLDCFGKGFTVLAGPQGANWETALRENAWPEHEHLPSQFVLAPASDESGARLQELYGIEPDGAVLVRPDGYIAARFPSLASSSPMELSRAAAKAVGLAG